MSKKDAVLKRLGKALPEGSFFCLSDAKDEGFDVIPTASDALNYALGTGGWVRGKQYQVYGEASTGKSAICYASLARHMQSDPDSICTIIDLEDSATPEWLGKFGIDIDRVVVVRPVSMEEAITSTLEAIKLGVFDMVIFDSLGSGLLESELENDKSRMGGSAGAITRLVKAINSGFLTLKRKIRVLEENGDDFSHIKLPAVIHINQARVNMNSYGDPITYAGGKALTHMMGAIIRLSVSTSNKEKVEGTVDGVKQRVGWLVNAKVVKNKLSVPYRCASYRFVFHETEEHPDFGIDNIRSICDLSLSLGIARTEGKTIYYKDENGEEQHVVGRNKFLDEILANEALQEALGREISQTVTQEDAEDEDLESVIDVVNEQPSSIGGLDSSNDEDDED